MPAFPATPAKASPCCGPTGRPAAPRPSQPEPAAQRSGRRPAALARARRWLALAPLLVLAACASAPPVLQPVARGDEAAMQRQVQALVAHERSQGRLASIALALVDARGEVWAHAQGLADVAADRPATPDTLYRMGSISKLFTDVAALQLVQQSRLQLETPLPQALPGLALAAPWPGAVPTLRQLMSHHSGLPRDRLGGMWTDPAAGPVPDVRALPALLADTAPALPAGTAWSYSNIGLSLLGLAIERAAGQPFEQQLQQALLQPLGMASASFGAAPSSHPAMARGHLASQPRPEPALRDVPAGGLDASVRELGRFLTLLLAGGRTPEGRQLLAPEWVAEMQRVQNAAVPLDLDFKAGLGWLIDVPGDADDRDTVRGAGPVLQHGGATFHFRSQVLLLPAQGLGVVVASNDARAGAAVNRIAAQALALLLQARSGLVQPPVQPGFVPAERGFSADERSACSGDWLTPFGLARIHAEGEALVAQLGSQRLALRPGQAGRFGLQLKLLGLVSVGLGPLESVGFECRSVAGQPLLLAWRDGRALRLATRLAPPAQPLTPALAALAGRYAVQLAPGEVPTLQALSVLAHDDRLWLQARLHEAFGGMELPEMPVELRSDTEARLIGPLPGTGERVQLQRAADGSLELLATGWRLRRIADR